MMQFFQTAISPEQKEISARVKDKGGAQAVMENDRLLRELVDLYRSSDAAMEASGARVRRDVAVDVEELRLEIREDVEVAVQRNADTFSRKFEMQRKLIVDELSRVVHREGDRIIDAITGGPHDRIIDPVSACERPYVQRPAHFVGQDLHAIWKEMVGIIIQYDFTSTILTCVHSRVGEVVPKPATLSWPCATTSEREWRSKNAATALKHPAYRNGMSGHWSGSMSPDYSPSSKPSMTTHPTLSQSPRQMTSQLLARGIGGAGLQTTRVHFTRLNRPACV